MKIVKIADKWLSAVGPCDLCKTDLNDEEVFYDAAVGSITGPWGLLCDKCFKQRGVGLGQGVGQKYDAKTKKKLAG